MVGGFVTAGLLLALTQHAHAASPTCLPGA
jgi:hypothetical protein